jgi:hemolysin D
MTSANKVVVLPQKSLRRREHELAFLPAALEITETPPSPIGRAIGLTIISLFCLALAWAFLGSVDIVATAPGKIIPTGRTKTIQPFETGVVRAIHVRDGQRVKAGDVLIELDPTMSDAERDHLRSDLMSAGLDIARLRAALQNPANPIDSFNPPQDATPNQIEMHRQFLVSQTSEQTAKLTQLDQERSQKAAEQATIAEAIAKLEATIPLLQQRVDVRKYLFEKELGSKITYLTELQDLVGQQHDVLIQKSRYREAVAALLALDEARAKTAAEYRRGLFDELAKVESKAAGLAQDLIKAEQRTKLQQLTAPVDGIVQQLAVHTVGGVVTPAQELAMVVPVDSHLEIEAMVSNLDVGFVHAGQEAEIKVDTFNFTRYGLLRGEVLNVSRDAIARDKGQEKSNDKTSSADLSGVQAAGQSLVYMARVSLDQTKMEVDDRLVNLSPGMSVMVEIKTGSRRIINYLLSPLVSYRQEVLRER